VEVLVEEETADTELLTDDEFVVEELGNFAEFSYIGVFTFEDGSKFS
jgi:hypothetical protein